MSPTMMRHFWSTIDALRSTIPFALDDRSLVQWLLRQVCSDRSLATQEPHVIRDYIAARLSLIRDMAQESQFSCHA